MSDKDNRGREEEERWRRRRRKEEESSLNNPAIWTPIDGGGGGGRSSRLSPAKRAHEFADGGDEAGAAVYLRLVKAIAHLRPKLRPGEP